MALEHSPVRDRKPANAAVNDPSYTVDEFCAAERMSRSMVYKAWAEGWGPDFYWVGACRCRPLSEVVSRDRHVRDRCPAACHGAANGSAAS
jgi:hypothetical protein